MIRALLLAAWLVICAGGALAQSCPSPHTGYGPRLWQRRGGPAVGYLPAWQAAFGRKSGIPPARTLDGGLGRTPEAPEWTVGSPPIEAPDPAAAKGRA
jgi:hypothetical protein